MIDALREHSVVVKLWEGRMVDLFIREVQPVKKERQKISVALSCDLIKQLIESEEEPQAAIEAALRQYFNQSLQE